MNVLILEDDEARIKLFRQFFIGHSLDITKNPDEANQWISEKEYNLISLDHDLNERDYVTDTGYSTLTGYGTALFLSENPDLSSNAKIIIHSLNPVGANRMQRVLESRGAIRVPYHEFATRLTIN